MKLTPQGALRAGAVCLTALVASLASGTPAAAETPTVLSHAAASERADFDVYLPLRDKAGLQQLLAEQQRPDSPQFRHWLTPAEFQARFGATPASVARVTAALRSSGFQVGALKAEQLHVTATAANVERAFGVHLNYGRFADGSSRLVADRALALGNVLSSEGAHVAQFTTVPAFQKYSERVPLTGAISKNVKSTIGPYLTADLRQAYRVPSLAAVNGKNVTIAILISGGYSVSDLEQYFEYDGLPQAYWPQLSTVLIDGGLAFSTNNSGETELDITQSSGMAPGVSEILYNLSSLSSPTTLAGLTEIVAENEADIVNMSFGLPEIALTANYNGGVNGQYIEAIYDDLFAQGNAQGITFFAASGDHGANGFIGSGTTRVTSASLPAVNPNVTAVGGTNLITAHVAGSNTSAYAGENALPDPETTGQIWSSGGGISLYFAKPAYQKLVTTNSTTHRTVPDIALHMGGCPGDAKKPCGPNRSSDFLFLGGELSEFIGTSAASPDMAGVFALIVKKYGSRLGNVDTGIYEYAQNQITNKVVTFDHSAITGNNGVYTVKAPYDDVIGNGTPIVWRLMGYTAQPALSGIPGTASNP